MTFPVNSPERSSLIPVISTLLQFNDKELAEVDKAVKDPNWSTRHVREIKKSVDKAAISTNSIVTPSTVDIGQANERECSSLNFTSISRVV